MPEPSYEETALSPQTVGRRLGGGGPEQVLPQLLFQAFPRKKGKPLRSNNDQSSCPVPSLPLNAREK